MISAIRNIGLATVAIGAVALSGCNITISDGYFFTYKGDKVEKSESGSIDTAIKQIEIDNRFGSVTIEEKGGAADWQWSGACWADTKEEAEVFLAELRLEVTTDGDRQQWKVVLPESHSGLRGVKSNLVIHAPSQCQVTSVNRHGETKVSGLAGEAKIKSAHGDVWASQLLGGAEIDCQHGKVDATQLAADCSIDCQHGDVIVSETLGSLNLEIQHGDVEIKRAEGDLNCDSQHSDVQIEFSGSTLTIDSQHGDIELTIASPELSGGEITTIHGDIDIVYHSKVAPNIDMDVSHGDSSNEINTSVEGPRLKLKARHGDIRVTK